MFGCRSADRMSAPPSGITSGHSVNPGTARTGNSPLISAPHYLPIVHRSIEHVQRIRLSLISLIGFHDCRCGSRPCRTITVPCFTSSGCNFSPTRACIDDFERVPPPAATHEASTSIPVVSAGIAHRIRCHRRIFQGEPQSDQTQRLG